MAEVRSSRIWTRQPQGGAGANPDFRLAFLVNAATGTRNLGTQPATSDWTQPLAGTSSGVGWVGTNNTTTNTRIKTTGTLPTYNEHTYVLFFQVDGAPVSYGSYLTGETFSLASYNATSIDFSENGLTGTFSVTTGKPSCIVISRGHSAEWKTVDPIWFQDGKPGPARLSDGTNISTNTTITAGNHPTLPRGFNGKLLLAAFLPELVSAEQARSLSLNPWQLFAPQRQVSYFLPPPPSALEITPQMQAVGGVQRVWTRQPPFWAKANRAFTLDHLWWANGARVQAPIGGALSLIDAAGNADGVFGTGTGIVTSGNSIRIDDAGPYISIDDTGTGTIDSKKLAVGNSNGSGAPNSTRWSVFVLARLASTGGLSPLYLGPIPGGIEIRTAGASVELLKSNIVSIATSSANLVANQWISIGVTYNGTTANFYINGKPAGSGASAQTFTSGQYYISDRNTRSGDRIRLFAVFSGVLGPTTFAALHANPWQLFAPQRTVTYSLPTAPSAVQTKTVMRTSKRIWTRQPQGLVEVDWSNSLTNKLVSSLELTSNNVRDYAGSLTFNHTRPIVGTQVGRAASFTGVGLIDTGTPRPGGQSLFATAGNPFTVSLLVRRTAQNTYFAKANADTFNRTLQIAQDNSIPASTPSVRIRGNSVDSNFGFIDSGWHLLTISFDGTSAVLYGDSSKSIALSVGTATEQATENVTIGGRTAGTPGSLFSGDIAFVRIWSRALSQAEHRSLWLNPWQIFVSQQQIIYSLASIKPSLSAPAATSITNTTATPQVTLNL